jgi:hypothetical protein
VVSTVGSLHAATTVGVASMKSQSLVGSLLIVSRWVGGKKELLLEVKREVITMVCFKHGESKSACVCVNVCQCLLVSMCISVCVFEHCVRSSERETLHLFAAPDVRESMGFNTPFIITHTCQG